MERLRPLTKIYAILFILVAVSNFVYAYEAKSLMVMIFGILHVMCGVLLLLLRKAQTLLAEIIFMGLGVLLATFGAPSNFSAGGCVAYSMSDDFKRNKNIAKLIILGVAIYFRTLFFEMSNSQIISFVVMNYAWIIIHYYKFHHGNTYRYSIKDDQTSQIIQLLAEGHTVKEISDRIYLTTAAINKRISRLAKDRGCKTTYQLLLSLNGQPDKKVTK